MAPKRMPLKTISINTKKVLTSMFYNYYRRFISAFTLQYMEYSGLKTSVFFQSLTPRFSYEFGLFLALLILADFSFLQLSSKAAQPWAPFFIRLLDVAVFLAIAILESAHAHRARELAHLHHFTMEKKALVSSLSKKVDLTLELMII